MPNDSISLHEGCCSDLKVWSRLLAQWDGVKFFYDDVEHSSYSLKFITDAAPSTGFGGYFQGQWLASKWPHSFPKFHSSSALYEIDPIAVACQVWGTFWQHKQIAIQCDNEAVVCSSSLEIIHTVCYMAICQHPKFYNHSLKCAWSC